MKKILLALVLSSILGIVSYAAIGDIASWGTNTGGDNALTVDSSGNTNVKGALAVTGAATFDSTITASAGFMNYTQTFIDPATASATAYDTASISTTTLVAGATTLTLANGDYTDMIHPRNVVAVIDFATGIATTTVAGTLLITGVNTRGTASTESLTVSTNSATGSVAWSTITSLVWTITSVTGRESAENANLKLGSGVKMGIDNDVTAAADITKVIEAGSLTTTYTLNTTYDTISFVTAPNGSNDYTVRHKVEAK